LVDQVIDQLRTLVSSGEWAVNAKIPTEPELVEALGVGRNTVREAVRALAHSGILEVRQGDGTYVRATSEVSGALRRLCGAELREVLQIRRCLEVEGARLAASARTEQDLAELHRFLEHRVTTSHEEFVRTDTEFHLAVVRASHNRVLIELYRGLTEVVMASVASSAASPQDGISPHDGLVDAIAERDVERAGREAAGFLDELLARLPDRDR